MPVSLNQIDLNLFIVFEAIYAKRNLTRAAELLRITQPAVSNALARMRTTFNDPLFVSTPGGMVPTPLAENMFGRVSEALKLFDSSIREGSRFDPATAEKTFRVSMSDLDEALILPTLGRILEREAPGIRIESFYTRRKDVLRHLASGTLDLAVDAPLLNDPQLRLMPMREEAYVCVLREHHPLAGQPLTLESYLSLGHIHVSSRRQGMGHVDVALNKLGKRRDIKWRVRHYLVAPRILLESDLALSASPRLVQGYPVKIFDLPFDLPPMALYLYWHRRADLDQAHQWLRKMLLDVVSANTLQINMNPMGRGE